MFFFLRNECITSWHQHYIIISLGIWIFSFIKIEKSWTVLFGNENFSVWMKMEFNSIQWFLCFAWTKVSNLHCLAFTKAKVKQLKVFCYAICTPLNGLDSIEIHSCWVKLMNWPIWHPSSFVLIPCHFPAVY